MSREIVTTEAAPPAIGPYNQAVKAGGFVFTAGQIGLLPGTKEMVGDGVAEQTERVFRNLEAVLEAAGTSLASVVKTTVYLRDMADFPEMNEVYAKFFPGDPPARSTVAAKGLPMDARVEIDVIALGNG